MSARERLLSQAGLTFVRRPTSHDQLDAALCAWLGWRLHRDPASVDLVGERLFRDGEVLREGVILQVAQGPEEPFLRLPVSSSPGATALRRSDSERGGVRVPDVVPVDCQWVYFATPARADRWETAELAMDEGVICRPAHNRNGSLIANVRHVQPGDVLLLVYSDQGECEVIGAFLVLEPDQPAEAAPAVQRLTDPSLSRRLAASGYAVDPRVGCHTAFLVAPLWTPDRRCTMPRPAGNNALWRAAARRLPSSVG
jgi:hypothetical protein